MQHLSGHEYNHIINDILALSIGGSIETEGYHWTPNPANRHFLLGNFIVNDYLFGIIDQKFSQVFTAFNLDCNGLVQRDGHKVSIDMTKLDSLILHLNFGQILQMHFTQQELNLLHILKLAQDKIATSITSIRMDLINKEKRSRKFLDMDGKKLHKFNAFSNAKQHINQPHIRKTKKSAFRGK